MAKKSSKRQKRKCEQYQAAGCREANKAKRKEQHERWLAKRQAKRAGK